MLLFILKQEVLQQKILAQRQTNHQLQLQFSQIAQHQQEQLQRLYQCLAANEQYVLTGTAPVVASVNNTTGIFTGLAPGDYDVEVENTVTGCISPALSLTVNAIPSAPATATASVTVQPDCTTPTGTITATLPVLASK